MSYNKYIPIPEDEYNVLKARHAEFLKHVASHTIESIKVHGPLSQKQVEEVMLVREISKELQRKKEEEIKKAQAAETAPVESQEAKVNGTAEVAVNA